MKTSEAVIKLEEDRKKLLHLAGEMMATIRLNFDAGRLKSQDDKFFLKLIIIWERTLTDFTPKPGGEV